MEHRKENLKWQCVIVKGGIIPETWKSLEN